jgi:hypothetical protein
MHYLVCPAGHNDILTIAAVLSLALFANRRFPQKRRRRSVFRLNAGRGGQFFDAFNLGV